MRIRRTGAPLITRTFPTRQAADRWAVDQESALAGGVAALPLSVREYRAAQRMTVNELLDRYFSSSQFRKKTPSTQRGEKDRAPHLRQHLGNYAVPQITGPLIATYRDERLAAITARGTPISPDQVRLEMALLCAMLKLAAGEWNLIPSNPCHGISKPAGQFRERRLSEEEEVALRVALYARNDNRRLARFMLVAFYTGMRAGEVSSLLKSNVLLDKRQIRLAGAQTKNRMPRLIPLSDEMMNVLQNAIDASPKDSPFIFATRTRAGAYRPYDYGCAWQRTLRRAGIQDLRFHDLRHEFTSRLYEDTDLNDGQIAALTGHRDLDSLARYTHLRTEKLRDTVEAHALELVQRDVMDDVNRKIFTATSEAWMDPHPDWDRIIKILGRHQAQMIRRDREQRPQRIEKGVAELTAKYAEIKSQADPSATPPRPRKPTKAEKEATVRRWEKRGLDVERAREGTPATRRKRKKEK